MFLSILVTQGQEVWSERIIFEQPTVGDVFVSDKPTKKPQLPTQDVAIATIHSELTVTLTNFSLTELSPSSLILD